MIDHFLFEVQWASEEAIESVALRGAADLQVIAEGWDAGDPSELEWRIIEHVQPADNAGVRQVLGILHPAALQNPKLVVLLEYRAIGPDPLLSLSFVNGPTGSESTSIDHPDGNGWKLIKFGAVRGQPGSPFGDAVDQFDIQCRDVEIRVVRLSDGGPLGDVNLDHDVNNSDVAIVLGNFGATQAVTAEQGDTNADGIIDSADLFQVFQDMPE